MTRYPRPVACVALAAVLTIGAAACSGGDDDDSAETTTTAAVLPTTTGTIADTASPTTTTRRTTTTTTTEAETTTTVAPDPVYPLTGVPVVDEVVAGRPALVVKIDNNAAARPQSGLNAADLVFEEIVEAGTRFAAVFQSQGSDPVGPIRSGRTQDIDLLGSLNKPLFAWSGGNRNVTDAIHASDLVDVGAPINAAYRAGGYYRSERAAPHDLYAQTSGLWTLVPLYAGPPAQQYTYRAADDPIAGDPSSGVDVDMDGFAIGWTYDAARGLYLRTHGGAPHNDATSGQISTNNVIILGVQYQPSPADARSPEAQTIGYGEALVFSGGKVVKGTWERPDRLTSFQLKDVDGNVIALTPGRTWVELARPATYIPRGP